LADVVELPLVDVAAAALNWLTTRSNTDAFPGAFFLPKKGTVSWK